jgi:hypothetical protein
MVALLQERFPDVTTTSAISYINYVNKELGSVIPEIARESVTLNVTANQARYAITGENQEIDHVIWKTDASTSVKLLPTTQDELSSKQPDWPTQAAGTPERYYVQNDFLNTNKATLGITFVPKPSASTVTYPFAVLYMSDTQILVGTDQLPDGLAAYMVYLEGASYLTAMALRSAAEAAPYWNMYVKLTKFNRRAWRRRMPQMQPDSTFPLLRDADIE